MGERKEIYTKENGLIETIDTRILSEEKDKIIKSIKKRAHECLQKTDWYITRKTERNIDIPLQVTSWRNSVFCKIDEIEEKLVGIETLDGLEKFYLVSQLHKFIEKEIEF